MKKTILTYGLISGAFCATMLAVTGVFQNRIGFDRAEYVGYTLIVLSFLLVFFGVRSYRNNSNGGQITFLRAFGVGLAITLITCIFYVATWEALYFTVLRNFPEEYGAHIVDKLKASGASAAAIQAQMDQVKQLKAMYENPFTNAAVTFLEPFPIGLGITLLSAAVLRKVPQKQTQLA
jgi:hypothetical protein